MAILMDTMESVSVINALVRIQLRIRKIEKISRDQGTDLIEINRLVDESNGLLQLQEVTDASVDGQFRNYVEESVQILKKIIRIISQTLKNEKLPVLEKEEATLLLEQHASR